jgi:DNA-binding MarR family transcriptional regulator
MNRLDTSFGKAEDSPGFMLWKASNLLQRLHAECLRPLGVTPTQFSLMTCLVFLCVDGPVTPSRIVAHSGMDKMLVSDLVKALERKRLIRKKPNPEDGRSWLLEPSALGATVTNSAVREVEALDTRFFRRVKRLPAFHADLIALVNEAER